MLRGTRVVLNLDVVGASPGDVGKVSSRKKNGWLRVTVERTGKTISVRNIADRVERFEDIKQCELRSLSPLQRLEDAATAELKENPAKYVERRAIRDCKSGYLLYADEVRAETNAELTETLKKGEKLKPQDVVFAIAAKWKAEEQEVRDKWNANSKTLHTNNEKIEFNPIVENEIESISDSEDDEFDVVDPPDDAYGDLTTAQLQVVKRLIAQFKQTNKTTGSL